MKNYMLSGLLIAAFVFTGCQTEEDHHEDHGGSHNPVVTVNTPVNGNTYNNGDTVFMNIHMEDEDELHEGFLDLYSATDTLFSYEPHVHEFVSYDLDTFWVVNGIAVHTDVIFTTIALNHVDGGDTINVDLSLEP